MTIKIDNKEFITAGGDESCGPVWGVKYYGVMVHWHAPSQRDARRMVAGKFPTKLSGEKDKGKWRGNPVQLSPFITETQEL